MKTINVVLPIYDRLIKQTYERSKHAGIDDPVPVICPRHHLPPWQYNAEAVVIGAVTKIELINREGVSTDITTYFPLLSDDVTVGTDTYYKYDGDTLNYLLPEGLYYLKITHANGYIYYSDWVLVDCVYTNLISGFINFTYETFTTSGTVITSAINSASGGEAYSINSFQVINGESYTMIFYATINSGQSPTIRIMGGVSEISNVHTVTNGLNTVTLTVTANYDTAYLVFNNTANTNYSLTELILFETFSDKYLKFAFEHSCDLGEITYEDGFIQVLYLETETMEPTFPYTEKGQENGYGQFVPTFQRQDKLYLIRTGLIPQHIVDVLHRLKLHDTITLTDLVGDSFTVKEIDTEHEWQFQDRYYAIATITVNLNEGIVVTGCCSSINECE